MPSNKPEYQKLYFEKWYKKNKAAHIERVGVRTRKVRAYHRQRIVDYLKEHPCVDCGERDIVVLQFDHVRGKKQKDIAVMMNHGYSWENILAEIGKCEVRCANDHARRTAERD
jgi:hypothetical protein